ncbi:hypothetical protein A6R68_14569, partial [Neotoma lepida]
MCSWQRPEVKEVGGSEATLLNSAKIFHFSFGLITQKVLDTGSIYNPTTGYPIIASEPYSIINGYSWVLALLTRRTPSPLLKRSSQAFLADTSAPVATATTAVPAAAVASAKEESEESEKD